MAEVKMLPRRLRSNRLATEKERHWRCPRGLGHGAEAGAEVAVRDGARHSRGSGKAIWEGVRLSAWVRRSWARPLAVRAQVAAAWTIREISGVPRRADVRHAGRGRPARRARRAAAKIVDR